MGAGARRVHATDEPADARRGALIEPGPAPKLTRWRAHRCASHLGRPPARCGTPARGRGDPPPKGRELPPPGSGATPTRVPSRYTRPRAGAAGDRIRLGRRRATTGGQSRQLGAQPGAHPLRACGSNPPIACRSRHHQTPPPRDGSGGFRTAAPGNRPAGQDRTRYSPRPRRRQAAGPICCHVVDKPTTVTVGTQQPVRDVRHSRHGDATGAADALAAGNADRGRGCRRRRCRRSRLAVAADVSRC